jgi:hypothetical protein
MKARARIEHPDKPKQDGSSQKHQSIATNAAASAIRKNDTSNSYNVIERRSY